MLKINRNYQGITKNGDVIFFTVKEIIIPINGVTQYIGSSTTHGISMPNSVIDPTVFLNLKEINK